jgi:hypothetical protein
VKACAVQRSLCRGFLAPLRHGLGCGLYPCAASRLKSAYPALPCSLPMPPLGNWILAGFGPPFSSKFNLTLTSHYRDGGLIRALLEAKLRSCSSSTLQAESGGLIVR